MKIFLFIILIGFACMSQADQNDTSNGSCINKCLYSLLIKENEFSEFRRNLKELNNFYDHFNELRLGGFCRMTIEMDDCARNCDDYDLFSNSVIQDVEYYRHTCSTKLVEYASCYRKVYEYMDRICTKCGAKPGPLVNRPGDSPSREEYQQTCNYAVCFAECHQPRVIQECGVDANRALGELYKRKVNLYKLYTRVNVEELCSRLTAYGTDIDNVSMVDSNKHEVRSKGQDEDDLFGMSIAAALKTLGPTEKVRVKCNLLRTINEARINGTLGSAK